MDKKNLIGRLFFWQSPKGKAFFKITGLVPPDDNFQDWRLITTALDDGAERTFQFMHSLETGEYILLPEGYSQERIKAYIAAQALIEEINGELYRFEVAQKTV